MDTNSFIIDKFYLNDSKDYFKLDQNFIGIQQLREFKEIESKI